MSDFDIHPDVDWRQVYPGQNWRMPDGRIIHVGAIVWDGMERYALCTENGADAMHIPAASLVRLAERVPE